MRIRSAAAVVLVLAFAATAQHSTAPSPNGTEPLFDTGQTVRSGLTRSAAAVVSSVDELTLTAGNERSVVYLAGQRGGGTPFVWSESGVVDGVLTFKAANGYWVRQTPPGWINVTWAGAVPQADMNGADQTAAIQRAIDALPDARQGGTIFFPAGWYPCDGPIEIFSDEGAANADPKGKRRGPVILTGVSGPAFGQVQLQATKLIYRGSGRRFIDSRSNGSRVQDLAVYYSSPEFRGALIDFSWYPNSSSGRPSGDANGAAVERCTLGSYAVSGARPTTADTLVNLGNSINSAIRDSWFIGGQVGVRGMGWDQGDGLGETYFSNLVVIENSTFQYLTSAAILNPAQAWSIRNCSFEFFRAEVMYDTPRDTGMDRAIYCDRAISQTRGLEISGCWFGDHGGSNEPEISISNGPAHWQGVSIHGNSFGSTDGEKSIHLVGPVNGMTITGNQFSTQIGIELDNTPGNLARREGIVITANDFYECQRPVVGASKFGTYVFANRDREIGSEPVSQWWGGIGELRAGHTFPNRIPLLTTHDSGGKRRMGFAPEGELQFFDAPAAAATSGSADLPAKPLGFFVVLDAEGRKVKIPYYGE